MKSNEKIFFHISERYNRDSILKNGLYPTEVKLTNHLYHFRARNYLHFNENKILYMWEDSLKNKKFIKDMIYCKVWIHPRNKIYIDREKNFDDSDIFTFDFRKIKMTNYYPYTQMIYDIYKVKNIKQLNKFNQDIHVQLPDECYTSTLYHMDERYSHDDKILALSKNIEKDIEIVGSVKFEIDKNDKISIKEE